MAYVHNQNTEDCDYANQVASLISRMTLNSLAIARGHGSSVKLKKKLKKMVEMKIIKRLTTNTSIVISICSIYCFALIC